MAKVKRPLNRSIVIVFSIFIGLLCVISSVLLYLVYTRNMYRRYQKQLDSIVNYVEAHIDHDDMANCAKTYEESDTYKEFQKFFDNVADNYPDMHYMYLMQVLPEGQEIDGCAIIEICAANTKEDYEMLITNPEESEALFLGDHDISWFEPHQVEEYRRIFNSKKPAYFKNESTWGIDYTYARPVFDSNGNCYGLLCVDVAINEINTTIYRNIFINIALILGAGLLFIVLLILWMRRNVTNPLKKLERYVTEFAETSSGKRDPDELQYLPPEIHTKNEVEALSNAYAKLSGDMRDYVVSIAEAEREAQGLKEHVSEINAIAYKDALTHVKNKNAYEEKKALIEKELQEKGEVEFGIVMADINSLKTINDIYGHDKGDEFIKGASKIICDTYSHSSVYRIGGDEFVVLLQGRDYANRDQLIKVARDIFDVVMHDTEKEAWNRFSMAIGMSIWQPGDDFDVVFTRADQKMYEEKAKIKQTFKIE